MIESDVIAQDHQAPIEVFTCRRHAGELSLTKATCALMFRRGKKAEPWDYCAPCRGCAIGAGHAGEIIVLAPTGHECLRCGKQARRLIGKRLCPSCWNREHEILTGRYRRKSPPGNVRLVPVLIELSGASDAVRLNVTSTSEAVLWAAKAHPGRGILSVSSRPLPSWRSACQWPQLSLLPGA